MSERPLEYLEQFAIDVILERRYGKRAALLRIFLYFLSIFYGWLMRLRWQLYENRLFHSYSTGCLVISVGNMTVGGTGKTPVVEHIARTLHQAGRRVAILSRGYKSVPMPFWKRMWRKFTLREHSSPPRVVSDGRALLLDSEKAGDEPYMLASNLRGVVVLVDKDRIKSAHYATFELGVDTLVLDDGYQYLPLKERINLVLVDRQAPFGNRHILPRGTLREPKDHLRRSDVIFLTKCDGSDLSALKGELRRYNRHAEILECAHRPRYLQDLFTDERIPLEYLKGKKVGAVCGIAMPESFEEGLKSLGAEIIYSRHYADHHRYNNQEVLNAVNRTRARGGHALVTTEKDAVRLPKVHRGDLPVYFLRVEIDLQGGKETFEECVLRICHLGTTPNVLPQ
ncbi:MAG: tetraacyldisaccharide 4'-kinase [bacterium]